MLLSRHLFFKYVSQLANVSSIAGIPSIITTMTKRLYQQYSAGSVEWQQLAALIFIACRRTFKRLINIDNKLWHARCLGDFK
jgi:hypothetical protein